MDGAGRRRKGHNFERAMAQRFKAAMPWCEDQIKRGLQSRDGSDAPDVDVPGFWVECKVGIKPNPRAALKQAVEAASGAQDGRAPVAVVKDDRMAPFVVLGLDDFLSLVTSAYNPIGE